MKKLSIILLAWLLLAPLIYSVNQDKAVNNVNVLMVGTKCLGEPGYVSIFNLRDPFQSPFLVITVSNSDTVAHKIRLKIIFVTEEISIIEKIRIKPQTIKDFWIDVNYLSEGLNIIKIVSLDTIPVTVTQVGFYAYY